VLVSRVETKTVFSIFAKSENELIFAKFSFSRKFSQNFRFRENFRFPESFRENGYVSAIIIFKMINSNGNLTILVHVHYCCPVRFVLKHHPDLTILKWKCMVNSTVVRFVLKHHPDSTIMKCMESTVVRFVLKHHLE
jgi:hypothetical protein